PHSQSGSRPYCYWTKPTPDNRAALRTFLTPEATRWQYVHGVQDEAVVAPESYTLDSALLAQPGNDDGINASPGAQPRNTHHGDDDAAHDQPPRRPVSPIAGYGSEDESRAKRHEEERGPPGS